MANETPKMMIYLEDGTVKIQSIKRPGETDPFTVDIPASVFAANGIKASERFGLSIVRCVARMYPDQVDLAKAAAADDYRYDLLQRIIDEMLHDRSPALLPAVECMLAAWSGSNPAVARFREEDWPLMRPEIEGIGTPPT